MAKDRPRAMSLMVQCDILQGDGFPAHQTCPGCQSELELHQPQMDNPIRLLGTCPSCHSWFIYEDMPDAATVLRIRMPGSSEVQGAVPQTGRQTRSQARERVNPTDESNLESRLASRSPDARES